MMGKLSVDELAAVLVEKNGMSRQEAQSFVAAIFEVIRSGIDKDRQVKVKGLGTFKVIGVDARESVNVNTGARVLIDSHSKISFTPDTMMKELVNKPFSGFETVVLNEGVEFDDMQSLAELEPMAEEASPQQVEEQDSPLVEFYDATETMQSEEQQVIEEPVNEELLVEEPQSEDPAVEEPQSEEPAVEEPQSEEPAVEEPLSKEPVDEKTEEKEASIPWLLLLGCLVAGFALGYMARDCKEMLFPSEPEKTPYEQVTKVVEEPVVEMPKDTVPVKPAPLSVDSVKDTTAVVTVPEKTVKNDDNQADYLRYEAMDARVRHGAYYIIGTESVVKVREGDTPERVSRRYLGKDMTCYLEVYNGITASTPLKAGQDIKIPKLVTKKAMREKLARENRKNQNQ